MTHRSLFHFFLIQIFPISCYVSNASQRCEDVLLKHAVELLQAQKSIMEDLEAESIVRAGLNKSAVPSFDNVVSDSGGRGVEV
ncbi:hypothetical protein Tco_1256802 [Tanacetum coccineum]